MSESTQSSTPERSGESDKSQRAGAAPAGPNRALLFFLAILFLFAGGMIVYYGYRKYQERGAEIRKVVHRKERQVPKSGLLKDFTLTDRSGNDFTSTELKGKVWVASFFFASCPNSCKQQNESIRDLHRTFAKKGVTFLSITCDPKNDTAAQLRDYALNFTTDVDNWKFLTGDLQYIQRIGADRFQVFVGEKGHRDQLMVVDKWGRVRANVFWQRPGELASLRTLLDELLVETEPLPLERAKSIVKKQPIFDENGRLIRDQK